jgi:hypothetical protein
VAADTTVQPQAEVAASWEAELAASWGLYTCATGARPTTTNDVATVLVFSPLPLQYQSTYAVAIEYCRVQYRYEYVFTTPVVASVVLTFTRFRPNGDVDLDGNVASRRATGAPCAISS